jgi:DNA-binding CsgD family transcriptional regulator
MPGPLQVIAVSFGPGADFQGRVLAEVDRLQGRGVLRLLDVLFVDKNEDGTLERVVVGGDDELGALLSSLVLREGSSGAQTAGAAVPGFDPAEAFELAVSLPAGTGLAFLLVEHSWAQSLFDAIDETGGVLLSDGFLNSHAGSVVATEVAALEEAAQVIAAAYAAETRATLRAMVAETKAAEAIAASDAIRTAAAASAIRALVAAGLVEEEATHEAIDALSAAGLIVAAAEKSVAEAVTEDAERVAAAEEAVAVADEAAAEAIAADAASVILADEATAAAVAEDAAVVRAADEAAAAAVAGDAAVVRSADEAAAEAVFEDAAVVGQADEAAAAARDTLRAASLTVAEARVLRYLSTRLTFALIADKLGISRSAAKDRAERVYKKLGVHNRADAVRRARDLGLIT